MPNLQISLRIKLERERLSLSQEDFSKKCNVSQRTQSQIETGKQSCTSDYLLRASYLGCDVQYIITGIHSLTTPTTPTTPQEIKKQIHYLLSLL